MPESVFAKLALDRAARARVHDKAPDGAVIYASDFDSGRDGWTDMWGGFRPYPIWSLTDEMQHTGQRCMMLSTSEEASPVTGDPAIAPSVFKRFSRNDDYRYHHFMAHLAVGVGGYSGTWENFQMMIDTQKWDNTSRGFYKLMCESNVSPNWTRWRIRGDGGDLDFKTVTGAENLKVGDNDNKHNFEFVRLTIDLQANGGLGGYAEAQIGTHVFNLTGLGAGHGSEAMQWDNTDFITDFRGGFNIGFSIQRKTTIGGGCQLFVDDVVYAASNTL